MANHQTKAHIIAQEAVLNEIDTVAAKFLASWMANEHAKAEAEENENPDRYDVTEEERPSAVVNHFVIYAVDSNKFLHGFLPSGKAVFGNQIDCAMVFDRNGVEVAKTHGVSLPAPWFLHPVEVSR